MTARYIVNVAARVVVTKVAAVARSEVVLAGELGGSPRIDVRDVAIGREAPAVGGRHAGDAPALDVDAIDLVLEEDGAAGRAADRLRDRVDEVEEVMARVVGAAVVAAHERDVQEERHVARRQEVVAALPGEDGAQARRHADVVVVVLERPARVAERGADTGGGSRAATTA